MSKKPEVLIFGHSFSARLMRRSRETGESVRQLLNLSEDTANVMVRGHPGLTFSRVLQSPVHYHREICHRPMDAVVVDVGTNDLCNIDGEVDEVVSRAINFLDLLLASPEEGPKTR